MEFELAQMANALRRGSGAAQAVADDNFVTPGRRRKRSVWMQRKAVAASTATLDVAPDIMKVYSQWTAFKEQLMRLNFGDMHAAASRSVVAPLDAMSWEGTVPIAAYNLNLPSATAPARFPITELRGIPLPTADPDHFLPALSSNGKPLYGAYVQNSEGELCLQQLFEFSQTAFDAGVFVPLPTVGGHFEGAFGLDYARHRFCGSIDRIPQFLRWPGDANVSTNEPNVHEVVQPHHVATSNNEDASVMSAPMSPQQQVMEPLGVEPGALVVDPEQQLELGAALSNCHGGEGEAGVGSKRKSLGGENQVAEPLPERCHPCFLCKACKAHWGSCLPERYFENAREEVFRTPEEEVVPILTSEKTNAKKRKWPQARHGPKSKTSEYRGVNFYKRTKRWEAHIWHDGGQVYLGASLTKVLGARVYDKAALFLFGPDTEINFKPEDYQEEYTFMHRLTQGQMVVYLRRESRGNGEEARYPGVAKVKAKTYEASYRPRKEKWSHEHIGFFRTEDDAARAVLKEAKRRRNYVMAGRIMDVHHLRTIKPAPGKIKISRTRAKEVLDPSTGIATAPKPVRRALRTPASKMQLATAAIPSQEIGEAPAKRQPAKRGRKPQEKNATKPKPAPAAKRISARRVQQEVIAPPMPLAEEAPPASPAPLIVYRPRARVASRLSNIAPEVANAFPQPTNVAPVPPSLALIAPRAPFAQAHQAPAPLHSAMSLSGDGGNSGAHSANIGRNAGLHEGISVVNISDDSDPMDDTDANSSCCTVQSSGATNVNETVAFQTPPMMVADGREMHRAWLRLGGSPCLAQSYASATSKVIRPVARRWSREPEGTANGDRISVNLFPQMHAGGRELLVDLFGRRAVSGNVAPAGEE